jgi:protein TonB
MTRLWLAAGLALSGSLLLHGGGMLALSGAPAPQALAGGAETAPPLLGDSFADLAQGMAQPVAPVAAHAPASPAVQPVVEAAPVMAPVTSDGPLPAAPRATVPVAAVSPAVAPIAAAQSPAVKPVPQAATPKPARPRPVTAKGGETAARKGTSAGTETGQGARAQGKPAVQADGGRAAQASYGARVMRKIAATRKRTTGQRGTAIIAFSIGPDGQLRSVAVARSSGAADLDAMGLDHIRRAAPFPAPPPGTNARFSVEFKGR